VSDTSTQELSLAVYQCRDLLSLAGHFYSDESTGWKCGSSGGRFWCEMRLRMRRLAVMSDRFRLARLVARDQA
jgi:hypothetical protein